MLLVLLLLRKRRKKKIARSLWGPEEEDSGSNVIHLGIKPPTGRLVKVDTISWTGSIIT